MSPSLSCREHPCCCSKERNAGGQAGWRGRSCSTDQLQHLVMAGGDSGFVVGEDPDCYLEYKLRDDCWSETLTSSYGYKSMPYNALVALFPQPRERPVS